MPASVLVPSLLPVPLALPFPLSSSESGDMASGEEFMELEDEGEDEESLLVSSSQMALFGIRPAAVRVRSA